MNEYLVEDEYSFYEIDSECKIGPLRDERDSQKFEKTEKNEENCLTADGCRDGRNPFPVKRRNSLYNFSGCSCLLLYLFVIKKLFR